MGKKADLLFTIPVGMPFWVLGEHKPLIFHFFLTYCHMQVLDRTLEFQGYLIGSWDSQILGERKFIHKMRVISSISNDVVRGLLKTLWE